MSVFLLCGAAVCRTHGGSEAGTVADALFLWCRAVQITIKTLPLQHEHTGQTYKRRTLQHTHPPGWRGVHPGSRLGDIALGVGQWLEKRLWHHLLYLWHAAHVCRQHPLPLVASRPRQAAAACARPHQHLRDDSRLVHPHLHRCGGRALGWTVFGLLWAVALGGAVYKITAMGRWPRLSLLIYLVMGWTFVLIAEPVCTRISTPALVSLGAEGFFYTSGTYFFAHDSRPYYHGVWHIFVLLGSVAHWLAILFILS